MKSRGQQYLRRKTNINQPRMSTAHRRRPSSPLSPQYITGVYLPSAVLLVATALVKLQWIPFAAIIAASLGAWTFYSNRKDAWLEYYYRVADSSKEIKKTLKPDVFQEFPLKEKTVLSHNVAMLVKFRDPLLPLLTFSPATDSVFPDPQTSSAYQLANTCPSQL